MESMPVPLSSGPEPALSVFPDTPAPEARFEKDSGTFTCARQRDAQSFEYVRHSLARIDAIATEAAAME
jgi:hypothetical protein